MNIVHVVPYYAPAYAFGGVPRAVEGMARALTRRGHRVTVLTTDAYNLERRFPETGEEMRDGVRVFRVRNGLYTLRKLNLSTPYRMRGMAKQLLGTMDVIHLHEFRTVENLLITSLLGHYDLPAVLSAHGTMNLETGRSFFKRGWDYLLSARVARHIDHVVALAESELEDVRDLWMGYKNPQTQFSIIPNGIDLDEVDSLPDPEPFRARYGLGTSRIILFMGRLHRRKGVEQLTRAFLQANIPDTKLVLVGPDEGMRSTLEPLLNDMVVLTGYLQGETRLQAIAAANLFALPATGEGLSMAVLEAMGAGLPVLLSPGCNFPQVAEVQAGRIVTPQVDDLAQALSGLLSNTDELSRMGERARQLIRDQFTWDRIARQLEGIYTDMKR